MEIPFVQNVTTNVTTNVKADPGSPAQVWGAVEGRAAQKERIKMSRQPCDS